MSETHGSRPQEAVPTELVARLEAASVGSRELDAEVWLAATDEVVSWPWGQPDAEGPWCVYGNAMWTPLAALTTSLDAALALAERVLPGFWWLVRSDEWKDAYANVGPNDTSPNTGGPCWPAYAATGPLALCIAVLKATAANSVGTSAASEPNTSEQST